MENSLTTPIWFVSTISSVWGLETVLTERDADRAFTGTTLIL